MQRPKYPSDAVDRILLRFPDGLMPKLKALAERERRSVNKQVIVLIEQALDPQEATATGETLEGDTPAAAHDSTALQGGPINPQR